MKIFGLIPITLTLLGAIFQPPAEVHSVELTEWRAEAGGNGHLYEAVTAPAGITWSNAESYATAHGGYLATIGSKPENAFVFKLVDDAGFWTNNPQGQSWGPWLGGVKSADGNWAWSNNEGAFTYTNWNAHQPGKDSAQENRLMFYGEGKDHRQPEWGAADGGAMLQGFVVEYDSNPLPQSLPYVALFGVCVVGAIALGGAIYFLVQWRKSQNKTGAAGET